MSLQIDLNCDLGEYDDAKEWQHDADIMPYISSCNIACGAHAGNPAVMAKTIEMAKANKVQIGAHPSFPDRENFGRSKMDFSISRLKPIVVEQIQCLQSLVIAQGAKLTHIKPHGALYNQAATDQSLACLLAEITAEFDQPLSFYGLANSAMQAACQQYGVRFVPEGFADRSYTADGLLLARDKKGAIINDMACMKQRVITMIKQHTVTSVDGIDVPLYLETLCIHGDHLNSIQTAQSLHHALKRAGIAVKAPPLIL
ncbi:LamB/YcsF family protein [Marinicella litoralis]|uniref:UPF0271 protein n=1 Tax=Marinicella litoralis TaxID=644220 RepID=A0A4V3DHS8_9GAMM|nr:5-oxoprolinase subunit PxpA [Marinicella litoralis]TDR19441.1 UPF0271 protein [Marinicella litoralis]